MTYNPSIPQPSDKPAASQPQILTNFGQLNTIFDVNHYKFDFATAANRGKHRYCTLIDRAAGPATVASEVALYSKLYAGNSTLYYRGANNGDEIIMSNIKKPFFSNVAGVVKGQSFLPGDFIIQWGYKTIASQTSTNVGLATSFSNTNYMLQVSMERSSGNNSATQVYVVEGSKNVGSFNVYQTASGSHIVYWLAIGPT